jgi:alginate O-acetyltransferase complex protein AlgJ
MGSKIFRTIPIACFLGALCFPLAQMNLHLLNEFENPEKRELAPPPKWGGESLAKFQKDFEAFARDNFGLRSDLIRWNCMLRVRHLGVSPVPSVVLGKDGWLFYRSEGFNDGNTFDDFRGTLPISQRELEIARARLEEDRDNFSRIGARFLVVIAPNKNTIYSEALPDKFRKVGPTTRLDQFMAYMEAHSNVPVLDLRRPLAAAKKAFPVYFKTDSHWNSYGAYVGFFEIMRRFSGEFPEIGPQYAAGAKVEVRKTFPSGDLAQMLFMHDVLPEEYDTKLNLPDLPRTPPLGTVIFRHDSFGDNLYPFMNATFKRVVNIASFAPYHMDAIEREHPQIVLHVFAERYIPQAIHGEYFYRDEPEPAAAGHGG